MLCPLLPERDSATLVLRYEIIDFRFLAFGTLLGHSSAKGLPLPLVFCARIDAAREICGSFEDETPSMKSCDRKARCRRRSATRLVFKAAGLVRSTVQLSADQADASRAFLPATVWRRFATRATLGPCTVLLADMCGIESERIGSTPCVVTSIWDEQQGLWRSMSATWG